MILEFLRAKEQVDWRTELHLTNFGASSITIKVPPLLIIRKQQDLEAEPVAWRVRLTNTLRLWTQIWIPIPTPIPTPFHHQTLRKFQSTTLPLQITRPPMKRTIMWRLAFPRDRSRRRVNELSIRILVLKWTTRGQPNLQVWNIEQQEMLEQPRVCPVSMPLEPTIALPRTLQPPVKTKTFKVAILLHLRTSRTWATNWANHPIRTTPMPTSTRLTLLECTTRRERPYRRTSRWSTLRWWGSSRRTTRSNGILIF